MSERTDSSPPQGPSASQGTPAPTGADQPPRRRRTPRRATSGPSGATAGAPAQAAPPVPGTTDRSVDDTDSGWGERPADDDERFLRDVPPHW